MTSPITSIMIYASDRQEGFRWYQRAFPDAVPIQASSEFTYLHYGGVNIEVVNADEKVGSGAAGTIAYWHTSEFDARLASLLEIGAELFRGPLTLPDGNRMCQVLDPFGNAIGLREKRDNVSLDT